MQSTSLNNIIIQIQKDGFKCFDLYLASFGKETLINATECSSPDEAIATLNTVVSGFADNSHEVRFSIKLKTSRTASGTGVLGPIPFVVNARAAASIHNNLGATGANPFEFLAQMQGLGFVSSDTLKAQQQVSEANLRVVLAEAELKRKMEALEQDRKHFETEKKREQARLAGLEVKYNSNSEHVKDGFSRAFGSIINTYFPGAQPRTEPLGATDDDLTKDPKYAPIQAIGTKIFEQVKTLNHIQYLDLLVTWGIANPTELEEWYTHATENPNANQAPCS